MFIKKNFIIFLPFLYFGLTLCFHKNFHSISNLYLYKKTLYKSNIPDIPDISDVPNVLDISDIPHAEPFADISLTYLSHQDKIDLSRGKIIERKIINGSRVLGSVIVDIKLPTDIVFDTLTQFAMYQDIIPIVKSSKIINSDGINTVAEFILSRFMLIVNVKHTVFKPQRLIKFTLDTNRVNIIFKEVEGFWHVEIPRDRPEGYCRLYLSAETIIHKNIPKQIIDYGTTNVLNRATKWLKYFFIEKDVKNNF
jgi:ribosome-associated toxin RatA of RatAB toxin-antitoxin module